MNSNLGDMKCTSFLWLLHVGKNVEAFIKSLSTDLCDADMQTHSHSFGYNTC